LRVILYVFSFLLGTPADAVMIALYVTHADRELITNGGFDGVYTYFATDGFTQVNK
jgi:hypothetical protein